MLARARCKAVARAGSKNGAAGAPSIRLSTLVNGGLAGAMAALLESVKPQALRMMMARIRQGSDEFMESPLFVHLVHAKKPMDPFSPQAGSLFSISINANSLSASKVLTTVNSFLSSLCGISRIPPLADDRRPQSDAPYQLRNDFWQPLQG